MTSDKQGYYHELNKTHKRLRLYLPNSLLEDLKEYRINIHQLTESLLTDWMVTQELKQHLKGDTK